MVGGNVQKRTQNPQMTPTTQKNKKEILLFFSARCLRSSALSAFAFGLPDRR
jgi:hypothetical protein